MSKHWAKIGEAGALGGMRSMAWVYKYGGRVVFNIVLFPVSAYFFLRRRLARESSRDFLRRVKQQYPDAIDGEPGLWLSFQHFYAFGQTVLDKYAAWMDPPETIKMDPAEEAALFSLVDSKQGCLLLGSHFGNLEYSRGLAHRHPELVINVLIYDQHAANFARLLSESAPESRMNLMQVTDLDLELAIKLKDKVALGEWLLIAGDRVPVGEGDNVETAAFFGAPADFPIGPFVLASLLHCPVYLMHCYRKDGEYELSMNKFADDIRPSRRNGQRSYHEYVQRYATELEARVADAPLQWFNFYDFWQSPDNETGTANEQS
jgi:predicted LPLAT superfamily acyltransferase